MRGQPVTRFQSSLSLQWRTSPWNGYDAIRGLSKAKYRVLCRERLDEIVSIEKIRACVPIPLGRISSSDDQFRCRWIPPLALDLFFRLVLDPSSGRYESEFLFGFFLGSPLVDCSVSLPILPWDGKEARSFYRLAACSHARHRRLGEIL